MPIFIIGIVHVIPEPLSKLTAEYAIHPIEFLIGDDKELLEKLTFKVFGRVTTNFVPIIIVLSSIFWFLVTFLFLLLVDLVRNNQKPPAIEK